MEKLFGTDGIRGVANEYPITPEVCLRLGRAIARALEAREPGRHKVVIGKDTRLSGYMLETALTSGLVSEGATVLLTGPLPTPAVAHLTRSMTCDAGLMLTASHNPYQDNGIKVFGPDGYKLNDELEAEIESLIHAEKLPPPSGPLGKAFRIDDAPGRYIEFTKNAVGATRLDGLKLVIDCAHGAGYFVGPLIFKELGAEVLTLGVHPDGQNINDGRGALHPQAAAQKVRESDAHLGVCFDGDADRVIFIDEAGQVVSGDRMLAVCARALKAEGKLRHNTLVATIMSNLGLRDGLQRDGITLETTGVGDRKVLERMREKNYALGGENSGHLIFADHATTGDGIMSALMVLKLLQQTQTPLSQLAADLEEYPQILKNIPVQRKPPLDEVPELAQALAQAEQTLGENGRILARYSGTEKKLRILVEARDEAQAQQLADPLSQLAHQALS